MRRVRWIRIFLLLALIVGAWVAQLRGWHDVSLALQLCWLVLAVGELVVGWRARRQPGRSATLPEITAEQADEVRGERDRAGEIPAVRRLRRLYPMLSLLDARDLVRKL